MGAPPPAGALMEEPSSLARAALVCKPWCRLISVPRFGRRLREFHRTAPVLGLICNRADEYLYSIYLARFVTTCSFRPRHADRRWWRALDARHGRVLLRGVSWGPRQLVVWDPVTDDWSQLPTGPLLAYDWNAAMLCAACGTGACDQLDCYLRPFLVVFLGTGVDHMTLWVYSSEVGAWREPTSVVQFPKYHVDLLPSAIVGNALHFIIDYSRRIFKYDLATREMFVILQPPRSYRSCTTIMTMEDGGLGVARMEGPRLSLWSMEANLNGSMGWAQIRAIDLVKLLSVNAQSICSDFVGFAHGVGILFVGTDDGLFSLDLKSGQVRKHWERSLQVTDQGLVPQALNRQKILNDRFLGSG
ncbi:uncharacterized protein C2845_PM04G05320 [Panicum miliaceum]|uniref:F-box domain-containing protein n=1 Tax=Panicum miliaceum TaxID=4540 RepID=A0A3L6QKR4_PANMI|nr:uncharacterized protein C2845_PM04G05320 [Panicum miliaceum]